MSHRPLPPKFSGRIWENGEFGYSRVREITAESFRVEPEFTDYNSWTDEKGNRHLCGCAAIASAPDSGGNPLGLSHDPISHSPPKRARKGQKGITSRGRKLVRNACYRLRAFVPQRRLTLLTLTVPDCNPAELASIASSWSELTRVFLQRLRRWLKSEGLPGQIVGVFEIQEQRQQASDLPVLHSHLVFVGRRSGKSWAVSQYQIREWWSELLQPLLPNCSDWSAVERIETVKKNVENYLGKYMSKGVQAIAKIVDAGQSCYLPTAWYTLSNSLRSEVLLAVRAGYATGDLLVSLVESGNRAIFKYLYDVTIGDEDSGIVSIGKHGRLIEGIYRQILTPIDSHATLAS